MPMFETTAKVRKNFHSLVGFHFLFLGFCLFGEVVESKSVQNLKADGYYGFVYGIQLSITQKRLYPTNVRYSLTGTLEFSVQL